MTDTDTPTPAGPLDENGNGYLLGPDGTVVEVRGWYTVGSHHPPADEVDRVARLLQAEWAAAEPKHGVTKFPASYVATFADMARVVCADRARIVDLAMGASRILDRTADGLEHLKMDTPEDQELNTKVVTTHRDAAAAIRRAVARDGQGPSHLVRLPRQAVALGSRRAASRLPLTATPLDLMCATIEALDLAAVTD